MLAVGTGCLGPMWSKQKQGVRMFIFPVKLLVGNSTQRNQSFLRSEHPPAIPLFSSSYIFLPKIFQSKQALRRKHNDETLLAFGCTHFYCKRNAAIQSKLLFEWYYYGILGKSCWEVAAQSQLLISLKLCHTPPHPIFDRGVKRWTLPSSTPYGDQSSFNKFVIWLLSDI